MLQYCLTSLYFFARMWLGLLRYASRFLCSTVFVQSHIILWLSVFYSSAFLKPRNFVVSLLEQTSIPRSIFSDIPSLVICLLSTRGEIVRLDVTFDVSFIRCIELRNTVRVVKSIIRCSTCSFISSLEHRPFLSRLRNLPSRMPLSFVVALVQFSAFYAYS